MNAKRKSINIKAQQKSVKPLHEVKPKESHVPDPFLPKTRIRTAEGWKRDMMKKHKQNKQQTQGPS